MSRRTTAQRIHDQVRFHGRALDAYPDDPSRLEEQAVDTPAGAQRQAWLDGRRAPKRPFDERAPDREILQLLVTLVTLVTLVPSAARPPSFGRVSTSEAPAPSSA